MDSLGDISKHSYLGPRKPRRVVTYFCAIQMHSLTYCGQTLGCIKMPLGKEVGLGPGDVVLDGDSATPLKGAQHHPHTLFGSLCYGTVARLSCW